jgi:PAS domain S-box-containing protein
LVRSLDGTVLAWNAVAETLMGWPASDLVGTPLSDAVMRPVDRALARQILERCDEGETWSGELSVQKRDGVTIRLNLHVAPVRDADGEIVGTMSAAEDVTQLRVAEARIADLAEHLALALEAGGLGTWDWDMTTGVTRWNLTMCALFGRDPANPEVPFDEWVAMLHPDDVEHTLGVVDEALADPGPYEMEHRVVWPDGTERWLFCRGRVRVGGDGTPIGTIGCSGGITEQKEAALEAGAKDARRRAHRAPRTTGG